MAAVNLDRQVGLENFPDVPEPEFVRIVVSAHAKSFLQGLANIGNAIHKMVVEMEKAHKKALKQSDYTLWPSVIKDKDKPVRKKVPAYINAPDFKQREAIRNARSKQLSRPIGSRGCGFVWNRGRFTR